MHASEISTADRAAGTTYNWRRWLPAMALGPAFSVLAAVLGWSFAWPAEYQASAYLQVLPSEPQLAELTNPHVLLSALRAKGVAELPCVKRQEDPVAWLQKELRVSFPGEAEIMEVSMTGDDPEAVTKLVEAVVNAYMEEVVESRQEERKECLQELTDACAEKVEEVRLRRNDQMRLATQLGTPDSNIVRLQQENALQMYNQYRTEHTRIQLALTKAEEGIKVKRLLLEGLPNVEISNAEVDAYARKAGVQATPEEMDALRDRLREEIRAVRRAEYEEAIRQATAEANAYAAQEKQLALDVEGQRKEVEKIGGRSVELEMMEAEIANLDTVLSGLTREREEVRVELRSNARRIRIVQPALTPRMQANFQQRVCWTVLAAFLGLVGPFCCVLFWRIVRRVVLLLDRL